MCAAEPVLISGLPARPLVARSLGSGTVSPTKAVVEAGFKGAEIREELTDGGLRR